MFLLLLVLSTKPISAMKMNIAKTDCKLIRAFPAGRAIRLYCTGINHGPVSAAIPNAEGLAFCFKYVYDLMCIFVYSKTGYNEKFRTDYT